MMMPLKLGSNVDVAAKAGIGLPSLHYSANAGKSVGAVQWQHASPRLNALFEQTIALSVAASKKPDAALLLALESVGDASTSASMTNVGAALLEQAHFDLALDWLELAFELDASCLAALMLDAAIAIKLAKPSEAIAAYRKIIDMYPVHVEAYVALATLLKNERDWNGALLATDGALSIHPDAANICANRIDLLLKLDRTTEAIQFLQQLTPEVYENSAMTPARASLLSRVGRFAEAKEVLSRSARNTAALHEFDLSIINRWLTSLISSGHGWAYFPTELERFSSCLSNDRRYQGLIASYAMIYAWLNDDCAAVIRIADRHEDFALLADTDDDRAMRVFYRYVRQLALAYAASPRALAAPAAVLTVIGESHCLAPANTMFEWHGQVVKAQSSFIMGIQMRHLAQPGENAYKHHLLSHLGEIGDAPLLLTIGEIDCRPREGMWHAALRDNTPLDELMRSIISGYFSFLDTALSPHAWQSITLQGVPAPGYDLTDRRDPGNKQGFIQMIRMVNSMLKAGAQQRKWHFLDVHAATARQDGLGNGMWHLDRYHLAPAFYQRAMAYMENDNKPKYLKNKLK